MPNWTKEQKIAIDKDGSNIIVSAGAGSGKTAVLSTRVIRKLKEGININELLILTFTEAAAKEMKDRIRKKIKEENLTEQLNLIDSAFITTFDSYALSIVKKYYYLLDISPNVSIADSSIIALKKDEILNEIFEILYKEKNIKFEKLINDFTTKDDITLRTNIINISNKLDNLTDKEKFLNDYLDYFYNERVINENINKFNNALLSKIELIKLNIKILSSYVENDYLDKLNNSLLGLLNSKTYDEIVKNIDVKLPILKNAEEEAKKYKEEIKNIIDDIKKICIYENQEEIYNSILKTKEYCEIIIQIIKKLSERMYKYKLENELFEFIDIELLAIKVLKENKNVSDEIKNSLKEIMIDEYQDTNDIQEEFISYIANNNVYMVGDIKQSIYRFRNANPYIFKTKYDDYSNNKNGYKIDLNKNFRSRKEVLDGINQIFSKIMDDEVGGADYINSHQMIFGNQSYEEEGKNGENNKLEIYNYNYDKESGFKKEEYEIFIIANDIKEKIENNYQVYDAEEKRLRNIRYNDFVILIDRSKDFDLYKKIFEYMNIPLSILKDDSLQNENILFIIKNLLNLTVKIKNNKIDTSYKHSLVAVLRSPLFEYSDNDILEIFNEKRFKENEVYNTLSIVDIDSMTTKELIQYFIDIFNFYENIIKVGNISTNMVILEYIVNKSEELSKIGYSIDDFVNYLENILKKKLDIRFSINKDDNNSVKIMTIHKSKGLEYSVCYFPGLYNKFNKQELKDLFIYDKEFGIILPYFEEGIVENIYKYLLKEKYNKEEISEKLRLFYVSLTRAREKMILICDLNNEFNSEKDDFGVINYNYRLKYNSFNDIILSLKQELKDYIKNVEVKNITSDYAIIKPLKYDIAKSQKLINVNKLEKDEELKENKTFSKNLTKLNTINEIENMEFGTYMHYLLETINLKTKDISHVPIEYKKQISNFLNLEIFDNINESKIFKEYEFMFEENNSLYHGIIDLMVVYDDYVDIIDYKLKNVNDENYIKQLNGYKKYIENKLKKKVNIYLYSIIDNELVDLNVTLC